MRGDAMRPLLEIADSLVARGVKRVAGRLVAASALSGPPLGFGWAWDDLDYPYSAGISGLLFNEGFTRVIVRGGARAGDRPTVVTLPARRGPPVRVVATTGTRGDGVSAEDALVPAADPQSAVPNAVMLGGVIAPGDSVVVEVAHRDPTAAYAAALQEALLARGISVAGEWATDTAASRPMDTLLVTLSPSLREILPAMEKPSQNQIAELLFRTLGLERTGVGSADSGRRVVERQLTAWGAAADGFAVRDGSGLSRHDYVSPETIVKLLAGVRRDTAFRVFYDALPIAGVDGTIGNRMKGTPAQGNVHAKTGFVDKARSLSGYVTTADGHVLLFSFLANNWTTPTKAVERVQDAIAARLAALRLDATTSSTNGAR
jgi:serine-type D-Ala-D-Ala carboxypeptidase/endopeptidase (penicillin-binding protein 4)